MSNQNKRKNSDTDTNEDHVAVKKKPEIIDPHEEVDLKDQLPVSLPDVTTENDSMNYESSSTNFEDAASDKLEDDNADVKLELEGEGSLSAVTPDESSSDADSREMIASKENGTPSKKPRLTQTSPVIRGSKDYQIRRQTLDSFEQDKSCNALKQAVGKCLECRENSRSERKKGKSICRFLGFRKLRYTARGHLTIAGFPGFSDYTEQEIKLWVPKDVTVPPNFNMDISKFILKNVGDQFGELVKHEQEALGFLETQKDTRIIVRKVIEGLREMCDVCSTTLFNYHFTCDKCGFAACISCFKFRFDNLENPIKCSRSSAGGKKDEYGWLKCHLEEHKLNQLLVTQIIAGDELDKLNRRLVEILSTFPIEDDEEETKENGSSESSTEKLNGSENGHDLSALVGKTANTEEINSLVETEVSEDCSSIFDMWDENKVVTEGESSTKEISEDLLPAAAVVTTIVPVKAENILTTKPDQQIEPEKTKELKHFKRLGSSRYSIKSVPKQFLTSADSSKLFPNVPHDMLCSGMLLRLLQPSNPGNLKLFQRQWRRGQPVVVSHVTDSLNPELWTPESFSRDFGHKFSNLINCMTGKIVPSRRMKRFWDGFEDMNARLKDNDEVPMLLKLKDWPPGADFKEIMPERFADLMAALPLGEYTHRDGLLNLAGRLPEKFIKPDLGPKMYIAYGSGLHLDKGTTNLHLDVSDAANVLVYVGVTKEEEIAQQDQADAAVIKAIEDSDCDLITIQRVTKHGELPGALWHIWEARDADKIRDMLNQISLETGNKVEQHHDPIHDQSWYLDKPLRQRLQVDYNVHGYPILQCAGDSVFIPAGAPHQVRNLNNCIKIAEDFVSPENIGHCVYLTEEFRNLTETHTNHEDKLQVKGMLYHSVKDAIGVIDGSSTFSDVLATVAEVDG